MTTCTGIPRVNDVPKHKVQSDIRSSQSGFGKPSRHDPICLQWYFCIATDTSNRCSSERSSEGCNSHVRRQPQSS